MSKLKDINYQSISRLYSDEDIASFRNENSLKKIFIPKKIRDILLLINGIAIVTLIVSIIVFSPTATDFKGNEFVDLVAIIFSSLINLQGPIFFGLLIFIMHKYQAKYWQKHIRMISFAKDNSLAYTPSASGYHREGIIFDRGRLRKITDLFVSPPNNGPGYEFANYECTIGANSDKKVIRNSYIRIKLNRQLPHIALDSKENNLRFFGKDYSDLSVEFNKDQKLSLEGDFDKYFTLYAPQKYERDVLRIFTPDLMALFIDQSKPYDAEIIDDNLYVYSNNHFDLLDLPTLERIFKIIFLVGEKAVSQADKYADERIGDRGFDVIGGQGKRLKNKTQLLSKRFVVILAGVFFVGVVLQLVLFLSSLG